MAKLYRYFSSSLSRHAVPALKRHLPKIGTPLLARGLCHGKHSGWYELVVRGTNGRIVLRGCSWGYRGEGPHATRDALVLLGIPQHEADRIAFTTPGQDVGNGQTRGKEHFRLHLLPQPVTISPAS